MSAAPTLVGGSEQLLATLLRRAAAVHGRLPTGVELVATASSSRLLADRRLRLALRLLRWNERERRDSFLADGS